MTGINLSRRYQQVEQERHSRHLERGAGRPAGVRPVPARPAAAPPRTARRLSDGRLKVDTDKAWDGIHRCLTNGTLDPDAGEYPLSHVVLGGRHLHDEYYVVYVSAREVLNVADALKHVDRTWLRGRFNAIDDPDYDGTHDAADFEYTWGNFLDVQTFFERAAAAGRAVVFTAT